MSISLVPLDAVASNQFGLVTRAQVLEVMSRSSMYRLVERGVLVCVAKGVYRLAGVPVSWRQRALAACLAAGEGAVVSHLAAAHLWELPSIAAPPLQLTVPPSRHLRARDPAPRRLLLGDQEVTRRWGIPVTTPVRTVTDLAREIAPSLLERVLDDFVRARHLDLVELAGALAGGVRLRATSLRLLEEMIAARAGRGEGGSAREDWAYDAIVSAGLPPPVRRHLIELGGEIREIDLAYPERKVAIEYDGYDVHRDATHFHRDREKAALLQLIGWIVLQVTKSWSAQVLVDRVRQALALRAA